MNKSTDLFLFNRFVSTWIDLYGEDVHDKFFDEQFQLMCEGVRDGRIHDNTFTVWEKIGEEIFPKIKETK